jgi:hypothetical protein
MKFYARGDQLYPVPLVQAVTGQQPRFVGRALLTKTDKDTGEVTVVTPVAWAATEEPWECPDRGAVAGEIRREFSKCQALKQEPPLWPADPSTARLVGEEFRAITVKDGVASAAPVATKKAGN